MYLLVTLILIYIQPSMLFTTDGKPKQWSLERNSNCETSVFSPAIVFPVVAIICYYISAFIEINKM